MQDRGIMTLMVHKSELTSKIYAEYANQITPCLVRRRRGLRECVGPTGAVRSSGKQWVPRPTGPGT